MVGYVELGHVGHSPRMAFVELPLVAPTAADRGLLAVAILKKVAETAFRELGFLQLYVRLNTREDELDACCWQAWDFGYNYTIITATEDSPARYLGRLKPCP